MKKIRLIILVFVFTLLFSTSVFAAEASTITTQDITSEEIEDSSSTDTTSSISLKTACYYYWKVTSIKSCGLTYGKWRNGPSAYGKCTLTLSKSVSVSNTISGSYSSTLDISSAIGFSVTKTKSTLASVSYDIDKGEHCRIKYRAVYKKYKVTQTRYLHSDGSNIKTSTTRTSYVYKYESWDYKCVKLSS